MRISRTAVLPATYAGPVSYYVLMLAYDKVVIDAGEHYVKQTYRNRCEIASPQGVQSLTIPAERTSENHVAMRDVGISEHGDWRHLHWQALVTAYDGSPYFEYYMDELREIYEADCCRLLDFNEALRRKVCEWIDIQPSVTVSDAYVDITDEMDDFRASFSPKKEKPVLEFPLRVYHQVFEHRYGFLSDLSILDLVFNMGPESLLYLVEKK